MAVMMPSIPFAPRSAKKSSGCSVGVTRRSTPSPVTTSMARTMSMASP